MHTPAWFDNSLVTDKFGQPLVTYHGTTREFNSFDPATRGQKTGGADARAGFFFAENPDAADQFTWENGEKTGCIMPVYLALKNPLVSNHMLDGSSGSEAGRIIAAAKAMGHDGVIFASSDMLGHKGRTYVAFHPDQIRTSLCSNQERLEWGLAHADDDSNKQQDYPTPKT